MREAEAKVVEKTPADSEVATSFSSPEDSAGTLADDESLAALRDKLAND